jgi:hypothetical protein
MTVEKNMARNIWIGLTAADRGWKVTLTPTNPILAEQAATP